jgi:hypothetical protein
MGAGASGASARTWIASPSGSEDGTIAEILVQVDQGDSIRLQAGEHDWPDAETTTSLVLVGETGASIGGDDATFRDAETLRFFNISFHFDGSWSIRESRCVTVSACEFIDFTSQIRFSHVDSLTIVNSSVRDNSSVFEGLSSGMRITTSKTVVVEGCVFARNKSRAGAPWDKTGGGGAAIQMEVVADATIRKCVFVNNEAISGSAVHCRTQGLLFEQNTVVGNRSQSGAVVIHSEGHDVVVRQNVFAGNADFALWIGDEQGLYIPRIYCNGFWENNSLGILDFGERENIQWRAVLALGYEKDDDFYSVHGDPHFCADSLTVGEGSVLANPLSLCAPIGGAHDIGCVGNPPVRETSWGRLKWSSGQ